MKTIERLHQFIEKKSISLNAFDTAIGAGNGYIGKAIKNKTSIGSDVIEKIIVAYPDLNPLWLITGEGAMLTDDKSTKGSSKNYNSESLSSVLNEPDSHKYQPGRSPVFYADFKALKDAMVNTGKGAVVFLASMPAYVGCSTELCHADTLETQVPKESWLFIAKIDKWHLFLETGKLYMIVLTDARKLYYKIEANTEPGKMLLVPVNTEYPPVKLDKSLVDSVWIIKGYLPPPLN